MLAACGAPLSREARYAGPVTDCATGKPERATLVRAAGRFTFAPTDGVLAISGDIAASGDFEARLITSPARRDAGGSTAPYAIAVHGRLTEDAAEGTFVTPRCSAAFRLPRLRLALSPW